MSAVVPRVSRRRFLGLAAAAIIPIPMPIRSRVAGEEGESLRAAVIGHTGRGDYGHGLEGIFRDRAGIELVGLADPDAAGRAAVARRIGAPRSYGDYREMLERERPQLVSLAMRHADQHHEIGLACLRAGAHCYFEKPFARTPAEADDLMTEAAGRGLRIAVAHTMRLMPVVQRLKREVDAGRLGELREFRVHGKQDARAGGEDMMVLGSHLFDLLRLFAGDPRWVTGRVLQGGREITLRDRRKVKDDVGWVAGDQVFAQFGFDGGVHATFVSDGRLRETAGPWGIELLGSRGAAQIGCDLQPRVYWRERAGGTGGGVEDRWRPWEQPVEEATLERAIRGPADDWMEAVRRGREPECSARNGAWAVEMVMGIYRASLSGYRWEFPLRDRSHPLDGVA